MNRTKTLVDKETRGLLALSPAYQQLPPDKQQQIARDMAKVGAYLAQPEGIPANTLPGAVAFVSLVQAVDFPKFVAGLINGVFQAIVESSIQQMEAYGKMIANVADSVDQFMDDNVSENSARDWLVQTYPDALNGGAAGALKRLRCPVTRIAKAETEKVLVEAARRRIATQRQQLLATMVLMGSTR
ncbi:MAG TPA: hypothetical protein VER03_05025 [Bryobacteraceae bacterium]|nr:hypothetical protein [Bryobacteraceae bacterium]